MEWGLAETINELKKRGYVEDFNLLPNRPVRFAEEFKVDEVYRFDEATDPSDQAVLYAISSRTGDRKGILVNGYGLYSDDIPNDMMESISRGNHAEPKH